MLKHRQTDSISLSFSVVLFFLFNNHKNTSSHWILCCDIHRQTGFKIPPAANITYVSLLAYVVTGDYDVMIVWLRELGKKSVNIQYHAHQSR